MVLFCFYLYLCIKTAFFLFCLFHYILCILPDTYYRSTPPSLWLMWTSLWLRSWSQHMKHRQQYPWVSLHSQCQSWQCPASSVALQLWQWYLEVSFHSFHSTVIYIAHRMLRASRSLFAWIYWLLIFSGYCFGKQILGILFCSFSTTNMLYSYTVRI